MNRAYYYLVASLPVLRFGSKPPLSLEDFLCECQKHLSFNDLQMIRNVVSFPKVSKKSVDPILKFWIRFNHNLRNELTWVRAMELNKEPARYIRGERENIPQLVDLAAQAVKAADPLEAQKLLDLGRWNYLEELIQDHYFDLECLIVYALKLKILERYQTIDQVKGKEVLSEYQKFEPKNFS